jgi:hypothetical protein
MNVELAYHCPGSQTREPDTARVMRLLTDSAREAMAARHAVSLLLEGKEKEEITGINARGGGMISVEIATHAAVFAEKVREHEAELYGSVYINDEIILDLNYSHRYRDPYGPRAAYVLIGYPGVYKSMVYQPLLPIGKPWVSTIIRETDTIVGALNDALSATYTVTGPHCSFCPHRIDCETLALDTYAEYDRPETTLAGQPSSNETLAAELDHMEKIVAATNARYSALKTEARVRLEEGEWLPGWRLSAHYGNRKLTEHGIEILGDEAYERRVRTPADLERNGHNMTGLTERAEIEPKLERTIKPERVFRHGN